MSNRRMWLRRSCVIALAPLLPLMVAAPAHAARGDGGEGDNPAAQAKDKGKPCPTDQWTVPLEVQGLACILLLPKKDGAGGGGGLGGLLG